MECDLRPDLLWIGRGFFELSNKRRYVGAGFGAIPEPVETSKIREYFYQELGLKSAGLYRSFRRLIDIMDGDWREDWREQDERRRQEAEEERRRQR